MLQKVEYGNPEHTDSIAEEFKTVRKDYTFAAHNGFGGGEGNYIAFRLDQVNKRRKRLGLSEFCPRQVSDIIYEGAKWNFAGSSC